MNGDGSGCSAKKRQTKAMSTIIRILKQGKAIFSNSERKCGFQRIAEERPGILAMRFVILRPL
jgi:hypothetical protein